MTPKPLTNVAASIRARLLNHAKANNDIYQRVLTRYGIERLLYRLTQTEAGKHYVLKGAMLFLTWPDHTFRPTGDLDLLGYGDPNPHAIAELFTRICLVEAPEDGIIFDPATLKVEAMREDDKYQGVRLVLKGKLAGAAIPLQVDIGFGDQVYPAASRGIFTPLLPDLPKASVLMYPPASVVAEKFEAMIRFGYSNGRLKDFNDLWVITRTFPFELAHLVEAIGGTLRRRETDIPTEMPVGLTPRFAELVAERGHWTGFLRRNPPALPPPPFDELQVDLRRFFAPIIQGLAAPDAARAHWDPVPGDWKSE